MITEKLPAVQLNAHETNNRIRELVVGLSDNQIESTFLRYGILSEDVLRNAKGASKGATAGALLTLLLRSGSIAEKPALAVLAANLRVPLWTRDTLSEALPSLAGACAALGVSENWCLEQRIAFVALPDELQDGAAQADAANHLPDNIMAVLAGAPSDALREYLLQIDLQFPGQLGCALIAPADFSAAMDLAQHAETTIVNTLDLQHLKELAEEGPVVELVNSMLSRAVSMQASDVHLEPADPGFVIRLRIDGSMRELERYASLPYEAVVCRIKILSGIDIAERRLPQDGRLDARVNGTSFDVRVSVIPMVRGESVVLRLLRQERIPSTIEDLGMSRQDSALLRQWLSFPNGLILVTGPTGSGKSTTLYTSIDLLGKKTDKIVTVEDPVEYKLPGVSQIQVNADIGLDFPQALRSILRHDPDVILVGEIRDGLTAQIATQAALTGHLVLSTLHTNTAAGAVTRLIDMGVDAFLLADSLKGVIAQRLVRRLCSVCKRPADEFPPALFSRLTKIGLTEQAARPMQPHGCDKCDNSGYKGRFGVYDFIAVTGGLSRFIRPGITAREIEEIAHARQNTIPWADGWRQVAAGETSAEEMLANTSELLTDEAGSGEK